jgi:predicted phosphodiesterase
MAKPRKDSTSEALNELANSAENKLTIKNKQLEEQNAALRKQLKALASHTTRDPREVIATKPAKKKKTGGTQTRAIISDTHGCFLDREAWAAVLGDLALMDVREIILLGDHVDCSGFLAEHHTMSFLTQAKYNYVDDLEAANTLFDDLQGIVGDAQYHYLEGNHEVRIERWINTTCLRSDKDRKLLRTALAPEHQLHLDARGVKYYSRGTKYCGLKSRGAIKLGKCHFVHEGKSGRYAAGSTLATWGANVVFGHTHRRDSASTDKPGPGHIGAWNPGCLCETHPLYGHSSVTGWTHGYGLQIVSPGGDFLPINVPIVDGRSLLLPMLDSPVAIAKTGVTKPKAAATKHKTKRKR